MISYSGERVRLRPLRRSDAQTSIVWRNDPIIRENLLGYRFPVTEKMEENWFESALDDQSRSRVVFAIETIENAELIGFINFNQIDWIAKNCYFGISIGNKRYHGKGIAPESMKIMFRYAFDCLNLRRICLEVAAFNTNAIALYNKFGFVEEGLLKEHIYLEGEYHDVVLMRIFDHEFRNKYK